MTGPDKTEVLPVSLSAALVAAWAEMPAVAKDGRNPHFDSEFVTLDALIEATRPVLGKHGLAINQFPAIHVTGQPVLLTRITHASGETWEFEMPLLLGGQTMQHLGAAITYARRFAWAAALGVAADKDDDGEAAQPPAAKAKPKPRAAAQPKFITESQRRRLFAIADANGVNQDALAELVRDVAGAESTKVIPADRYDELVGRVEMEHVPF